MEFRNETERKVLSQIIGTHVWKNIETRNNLKIELVKSSAHSYAIYNSGIHTGTFINAFFVNIDEAKDLGWKIRGKIEDAVDPDLIQEEIKKKRTRKKKNVKKG